MMFVRTLVLCTKSYNEMTVLTPRVEEIVLESGVQEGMVTVLTRHTTTGVTVNEAPTVTHACCATTARRQATPPGISKPC